MVGSRNENSVLFSLSSLQQVEAVGGPQQQNDQPLTEGSGLIDIQSLASTHSQMSGGGGANDPFGGGGGGGSSSPETFSPGTMSVPAIMPRGSHRDNKPLIIGVVVGVLLLLGGGIAAAVVLMGGDKEKDEPKVVVQEKIIERIVEKDSSKEDKEAEADAAAQKALAKAEQAEKEAVEEDDGADEEEDADGSKSGSRKRRRNRRKDRGSSRSNDREESAKKPDPDPEPDPKPDSDRRKGNDDEIDNILGSLDKKKDDGGGGGGSEPKKDLPKKLGKSTVQSTIRKYNGRINACAKNDNSGGLSGTVWVGFKVASSGRVQSASVKSAKFKGTDVGNCVTKVVRGMKFPAAQESLSISKYPFILR